MFFRIADRLGIERENIFSVSLILMQSVFLGLFSAITYIVSQSYFIDQLTSDRIPGAFFMAGIVTSVILVIHFLVRSSIKFSVFSVVSFAFIFIVALLIRLAFIFFPGDFPIYSLIVTMPGLIILGVIGLRESINRMYSRSLHKNLYILFEISFFIALAFAAFALPVLLNLHLKILNSLYISVTSILVVTLIQLYKVYHFSFEHQKKISIKEWKPGRLFFFNNLSNNPVMQSLLVFMFLSTFTWTFIHFSFLSVTDQRYIEQVSMASFIGLFLGIISVFMLLIRKLIFPVFLKNLSLKTLMLISPVIIIGLFFLSTVIGLSAGYTAASSGFTLYFILIITAKLFSGSLREVIELPVFKTLYQIFDRDVRYKLTKLGVILFTVGILISGSVLYGLSAIIDLKLIHVTIIVLFATGIWIISALIVFGNFKESLRKSLHSIIHSNQKIIKKSDIFYNRITKDQGQDSVKWLLEFAPQSWNGFITDNIKDLLLKKSTDVMEITLDWIEKLNIAESKDFLILAERAAGNKYKKRLQDLIERYEINSSQYSTKDIKELVKSIKWEDRLEALTVVLKNPELITPGILANLLRDNDYQIRISAIRLVGIFRLTEYSQELIEMLGHDRYYPFAYNSLKKISDDILPELDYLFKRRRIPEKTLSRAVRLISTSGSDKKTGYLVSKIDRTNLLLVQEVLKGLIINNYQPDNELRSNFKDLLKQMAGIAVWNLSIMESCRRERVNPDLTNAMGLELTFSLNLIFMILSILHDSRIIDRIKKNIESGSNESVMHSMELLEMVVDEENKEWMVALLNDIPVARKIYILQAHFPVTILQGEELLNAIINRNNNYLNSYTRILAIRELENLENYKIGGTIVCQLFNPDPLIAEEAVLMILKHDPDVLADIIPRLPDDRQEYFSKILEGTTGKRFGQEFYTFKYLRKCTIEGEINDFSLFGLARHFRSIKIEKDKSVDLCELFDDSGFVLCGTSEFIAKTGIQHINIFDKDIISTAKVRENNTGDRSLIITARGDMTLNVLTYSELRELIFDNENDFFSVLPALFYRTNYLSSSI